MKKNILFQKRSIDTKNLIIKTAQKTKNDKQTFGEAACHFFF